MTSRRKTFGPRSSGSCLPRLFAFPDSRPIHRYDATNFPNILKITNRLTALGEKYGMTSSQVALAWLLAQGEDNIPIPGTTKTKVCVSPRPGVRHENLLRQYLSDNLASFNVKLSAEDVAAVRALALQADAGHRHRYPPAFAKLLFADTPEL